VQMHEIFLILKLHVFEFVMAICSEKNDKKKQYHLSDTNTFFE